MLSIHFKLNTVCANCIAWIAQSQPGMPVMEITDSLEASEYDLVVDIVWVSTDVFLPLVKFY